MSAIYSVCPNCGGDDGGSPRAPIRHNGTCRSVDGAPSAASEDDGFDMLRLRASDDSLPWTDENRVALNRLLREHAQLRHLVGRPRDTRPDSDMGSSR